MRAYNHVCEDCGNEWEQGHETDAQAEAENCPNCGSESTQAFRSSH